jgi:hypothetical protein
VEYSSAVSGYLRLCPDGLSTCLLVGGPLEGQGALWFEKLHLFASFGAYRGNETIGALRIWKVPWNLLMFSRTLLEKRL